MRLQFFAYSYGVLRNPSVDERRQEIFLQHRKTLQIIFPKLVNIALFVQFLVQIVLDPLKDLAQFVGIDRLLNVFFRLDLDRFPGILKFIKTGEKAGGGAAGSF